MMKRGFLWVWVLSVILGSQATAVRAVMVSVDGLRPDAIKLLGPEKAPTFHRLMGEGAFTLNARTQFEFTITLPNHFSMLTGRPVRGRQGHRYEDNSGFFQGREACVGDEVQSVFDQATAAGKRAALMSTKRKFDAVAQCLADPVEAGEFAALAQHRNFPNSEALFDLFSMEWPLEKWDLVMVHMAEPDVEGHLSSWDVRPDTPYVQSIERVDAQLARLLEIIETEEDFRDDTWVIVTADHGGGDPPFSHFVTTFEKNYTIPFLVWGPGAEAGADLYEINPGYFDPGNTRPTVDGPLPPIRNGHMGNLALQLLGVEPIPGSVYGRNQPVRVASTSGGFETIFPTLMRDGDENGNGFSNFHDFLIGADPRVPVPLTEQPRMIGRFLAVPVRPGVGLFGAAVETSEDLRTWRPRFLGANLQHVETRETEEGLFRLYAAPDAGRGEFFRLRDFLVR